MEEETVVEAPEAEQVESKPETSDVESRARRMGWYPKDEYEASGRDVAKWVEADEFIRRGEEELPVLKERYRKLERNTQKMEKQLSEGNALLKDLVASQTEREKKAVAKAIASLKRERAEAVSVGDAARVEQISDEIIEHQESLKAAPKDKGGDRPDIPQEVLEWAEKNTWFNEDPVMNAFATASYGLLVGKPMTETQRLAKVEAEVMKRFPEKFANPNRNRPAAVEGSNGASRKNGKGWNDLPAEHRALAERLIRNGAVKTKEEYLKHYSWE